MSYGSYCMVINCNNYKKEKPELAFFSLPKKMEIATKWIEFSGRKDIDLDKKYTMCSEHFSLEQMKTVVPRKLLYPGSIPFLNGPLSNESKPNLELHSVDFSTLPSDASGSATQSLNEIVFEFVGVPTTLGVTDESSYEEYETREDMDSLVINEGNAPENCEVAIEELSKASSVCQSVITRREKLKAAYLEVLDSISNIEEIELMEKMFTQTGSMLAAIRDKSLPSFERKQDFVPNINIVPQRKFYSSKKKKSTKPGIETDSNENAFKLLNMKNK